MSRLAGLVVAVAWGMLAGCTADPQPPTSVSPSAPSTATPATPATPTGSLIGPVSGAECLTGTWRLVRFVGLGGAATYGTGQGGDVTVAFDQGRYTLVGQGRKPYAVNLAGEAANLSVDGTATGTYQPDGAEMTFTIGEASGQATLQSGRQQETLPMEAVSRVIAPNGRATVACPDEVLTITLPAVRLELER